MDFVESFLLRQPCRDIQHLRLEIERTEPYDDLSSFAAMAESAGLRFKTLSLDMTPARHAPKDHLKLVIGRILNERIAEKIYVELFGHVVDPKQPISILLHESVWAEWRKKYKLTILEQEWRENDRSFCFKVTL